MAAFGGGVEAAIHLEGLKIHPSEEEYYTSQPGNTGAPPMEHANAVQVGTMALPPLVVAVAAGAWIAQRRQRRAVRAEG